MLLRNCMMLATVDKNLSFVTHPHEEIGVYTPLL